MTNPADAYRSRTTEFYHSPEPERRTKQCNPRPLRATPPSLFLSPAHGTTPRCGGCRPASRGRECEANILVWPALAAPSTPTAIPTTTDTSARRPAQPHQPTRRADKRPKRGPSREKLAEQIVRGH